MNQTGLSFQHVTFSYDAMTQPLICDLTLNFFKGWTGIVGVNGAGKTTFLKLALGLLTPQSGNIKKYGSGLYCAQDAEARPEYFSDFLTADDGEACRLKGLLGISEDWHERWLSLSYGERKRSQIAVALWKMPELLAIDEPTNHLDASTCQLVSRALKDYTGTGLIVSHDRSLLDVLCAYCFFIDPPELVLRPGGYTQGKAQEEREQQAVRRLRAQTEHEQEKLTKELIRRRESAKSKQRKLSKRKLAPKDHDARGKRDLARLSGKDGVGGKLQRQLDSRLERLDVQLAGQDYKRSYATGISIKGQPVERNFLLDLPPHILLLGESRSLHVPALQMRPQDRIGITGNNGSGKSTLIRHIISRLKLAPEELIYIPQEITGCETEQLAIQIKELSSSEIGALMSAVSRLGSRPERLLESLTPSPGEARKILLAFGLMKAPALIVMDEPTNHLDILSIECIEAALESAGCGLLLVSHDRQFLDRLTGIRWEIIENPGYPEELNLTVRAL